MNYSKDTKHGLYVLNNPSKYIGTKNPVFKSGWEQKMFSFMDFNSYVKKWGYECQPLPYFNPMLKKTTIYYPDIFAHIVNAEGVHTNFLIEIKPEKFRHAPIMPRTKTRSSLDRYAKAMIAYQINLAKWEAAEAWCARHHVKWMILSEKDCNWFVNRLN